MKTWMHWHGGSSYAFGTVAENAEAFDTLADAIAAFEHRYNGGDSYYRCADETASAHLYFADPATLHEPYPDRLITIGPRGGVRVERC